MNKADQRVHYVYGFLREKDSAAGPKGSLYYIGKGCGNRAYLKAQRHIPAPKDRSYVVFIQEGLTEREALDLEIYCIKLYGRVNMGTGILRNLTDGGEGVCGLQFSEETRRRLSEINKGKKLSEETKARISRGGKGKKLKDETKQKIGQANACNEYELTAPDGSKYVTSNLSEFAREHNLCVPNICAVANGRRNHADGWTAKYLSRNTSEKPPVSSETRAKMSKSKETKKYELVSPDGEVFITTNVSAFAREHGLQQTCLSAIVSGSRRQHKGWTGRIIEHLR
jgi:hypothetical protein